MSRMWAVCGREFKSYFTTPVGYVITAIYALILGFALAKNFPFYAAATVNPVEYGFQGVPDFEEVMLSEYLVFCGMLIMFIGPLITMRLLAEERNKGTMELLLTHPLRDRDVIFGKYLASLLMVVVLLLVVGAHLIIMAQYAHVEPLVLVFGLFAVFLMAAAFMSLGLFVSALSSSQVMAGTVTFALWYVFYVVGQFAQDMPEEISAPEALGQGAARAVNFGYGVFRNLIMELPLDAHAREMALGIVHPKDIAYYVLFAAFFLYLTFRAFTSRKWRA